MIKSNDVRLEGTLENVLKRRRWLWHDGDEVKLFSGLGVIENWQKVVVLCEKSPCIILSLSLLNISSEKLLKSKYEDNILIRFGREITKEHAKEIQVKTTFF